MADIYSYAHITIAASAAKDGRGGCFRQPRQPFEAPVARLVSPADPSQNILHGYVYVTLPRHSFNTSVNKSPLGKRAWVTQERLLSTRTVFYGKDQLHWECAEGAQFNEDGVPVNWIKDPPRAVFGLIKRNWSTMHREFYVLTEYEAWYAMVEQYTKRKISRPEDKLPALSGLARRFAYRIAGNAAERHFAAGIWKGDMKSGLLWYRKTRKTPKGAGQTIPYRAPSWSWAAHDGPVFFHTNVHKKDYQATFENLKIYVQHSGSNPFGSVLPGTFMQFTALVRTTTLRTRPRGFGSMIENPSHVFGEESKGEGIAWADEADLPTGDYQCVQIRVKQTLCNEETHEISNVIFLKPTGQKDEFLRIGFGRVEVRGICSTGNRPFFHEMDGCRRLRITIF
ncbi:hypothetical protein ACEPPN_000775 [Leptodophora sp. 'Broadleaf-Isolate-01']